MSGRRILDTRMPSRCTTGSEWGRASNSYPSAPNRSRRGKRSEACILSDKRKTCLAWSAMRGAFPTCRTEYGSRQRSPPKLYVIARNVKPVANRPVRLGRQLDTTLGFPLLDGHHVDGIPGATIQERAVRPFTRALGAPDAGG